MGREQWSRLRTPLFGVVVEVLRRRIFGMSALGWPLRQPGAVGEEATRRPLPRSARSSSELAFQPSRGSHADREIPSITCPMARTLGERSAEFPTGSWPSAAAGQFPGGRGWESRRRPCRPGPSTLGALDRRAQGTVPPPDRFPVLRGLAQTLSCSAPRKCALAALPLHPRPPGLGHAGAGDKSHTSYDPDARYPGTAAISCSCAPCGGSDPSPLWAARKWSGLMWLSVGRIDQRFQLSARRQHRRQTEPGIQLMLPKGFSPAITQVESQRPLPGPSIRRR